ncbi:hypothetical protein [Brucella anthropi]|uniref:hypothetical protein n=1 Tax=Brucella anthropi TaxID=529 RepID=UPI0004ED8B43|nr:hypothetical protein [Brucella anthropi]AIK44807.1 hypothetical protein DR92_2237 [Brucella anthropi]KAB2749544.1 hypothetical protein F9K95_16380 [Brucella anthropi]
MFAETVIGYIDLIENKIPQRSYTRELNAALHLSWLLHRIDQADDRDTQKRVVRDTLLRWAIWNEGEKIFGLIEEASARVRVPDHTGPTRAMPITRDKLNHVIESVAPKSVPTMSIEIATSALPTKPYAFDLVHYDAEKNQLLMFSMVYGIYAHKNALCEWRIEASTIAPVLARLASEYYSIDIEQCEFALIDPLLSESQCQDGIWALADLDGLIGKTGIAEKALDVQEALREELIIWLGDTFAKTEDEQAQLIDEEIAKIAVEGLDRMSTPQTQILKPGDVRVDRT